MTKNTIISLENEKTQINDSYEIAYNDLLYMQMTLSSDFY